jgi:hypothetical protein
MTTSRVATALIAISALCCSSVGNAAPFAQTLRLQGVTFTVKAHGEGSRQELVVKAKDGAVTLPTIKQQVDGTVTSAEVEDLNSDGKPEVVLTVVSAGSGSYGSVLAWSVSKGDTLLPIHMPALTAVQAKGYMGHDRFAVVETTLARQFPIYRPADSNAKPTGGIRQIDYKMVAGEASWQFKPVRTTDAAQ